MLFGFVDKTIDRGTIKYRLVHLLDIRNNEPPYVGVVGWSDGAW